MGIVNKKYSLYLATGIDTTGLSAGSREVMEMLEKWKKQLADFDIFGGIRSRMEASFNQTLKEYYEFEENVGIIPVPTPDMAAIDKALNDVLAKYTDYTNKRTQKEKQFDDEIEKLRKGRTGKNAQEVDLVISEIEKAKNKELFHFDLENFKEEVHWETLFIDLDRISTQSLRQLHEKLKESLSGAGDAIKNEDLKSVTDALIKLDKAITGRTPMHGLTTGFKEYASACAAVEAAQRRINEVTAKGDTASAAYTDALQELNEAQDSRRASLMAINRSVNTTGQQGQQIVQTGNSIVGMLTDLGVRVPESVGKILSGTGQIMSGLASIDVTKPFSILTSVTGIVGGIGKMIGGIFGLGGKSKGQEDLERLEDATRRVAEVQRTVNSFIEKRIALINEATVAEQKSLAATTKQAIDNQKAYNELQFKNLQDNWLLGKKGKHNNQTLRELGIGSIGELADFLSSERLVDFQKQGYSVRDLNKWMELINAQKKLDEEEKSLQETIEKNLTGINLDDAENALDKFLRNADTSMADVAGSFEEYMENAILGLVKQNTLNKLMGNWYKHFTESMDSGGGLDENEVKKLRQEYEDAFTTAQTAYNNMLDVAGISAQGIMSRETSAKGVASMSQESANELNGSFNALLVYSGRTADHTSSIRESMGYILEIQKNGWNDVRIIKELTGQVQTNTAQLMSLSEAIVNNTQRVATGMDILTMNGLTLKR